MQGRRVYPNEHGGFAQFRPGDYWKWPTGGWSGMVPNGLVCNLQAHAVTEHEGGTITVTPSILVTLTHEGLSWHGHLKAGVWEEC